ncbi:Protein of unknown function [Gryllus bimaculatus]|nr:Protein of unknown function [Gryllus bimaculatus]
MSLQGSSLDASLSRLSVVGGVLKERPNFLQVGRARHGGAGRAAGRVPGRRQHQERMQEALQEREGRMHEALRQHEQRMQSFSWLGRYPAGGRYLPTVAGERPQPPPEQNKHLNDALRQHERRLQERMQAVVDQMELNNAAVRALEERMRRVEENMELLEGHLPLFEELDPRQQQQQPPPPPPLEDPERQGA